jgi:hypothetical protein
MRKRVLRVVDLAMAAGVIAVLMAIFAPAAMAVGPLDVSKTATGHWTRTFEWTIDKSVTPATHNMQTGQSGTSTYTITVTKSSGTDLVSVDGEVCVSNVMLDPTENLAIFDRVQASVGGGAFATIASGAVSVSSNPVLDPGESDCYPYSFTFTPVAGAVYRNNADITITNNPTGTPGVPQGPNAITPFTLPAPTLVNNAINVDDTNPAGDAGPFSSTTSYMYDRTFTCDGDAGRHDNTATIVETGASDDASVTVTCTPPPGGEGCTPGYWKNHSESWAAAGVPTNATMASRGFNVSASLTFMTALRTGGGGLTALLRHAAAAYLNAAHPSVDYEFTTAQIVAATNAAIASGNYEAQKNIFENANEEGAPGFCD